MSATRKTTRRVIGGLAIGMLLPLLLVSAFEFLIISMGVAPPVEDPLVLWNPRRDQELAESQGEFRFHREWL